MQWSFFNMCHWSNALMVLSSRGDEDHSESASKAIPFKRMLSMKQKEDETNFNFTEVQDIRGEETNGRAGVANNL